MKTKLEGTPFEIIRKRKLKEGEEIIGVATSVSGKKYNLVKSGKNKYMIPQ